MEETEILARLPADLKDTLSKYKLDELVNTILLYEPKNHLAECDMLPLIGGFWKWIDHNLSPKEKRLAMQFFMKNYIPKTLLEDFLNMLIDGDLLQAVYVVLQGDKNE